MRLNKLSHKSINSWLLLAALFAPILYLFGALWTTQLGAHGEVNLSQPVYVQDYVEVDSYNGPNGNNYKFIVDSSFAAYFDTITSTKRFDFPYTLEGRTGAGVRVTFYFDATYHNVAFNVNVGGVSDNLAVYSFSSGVLTYNTPLPYSFISSEFPSDFVNSLLPYGHIYVLSDVPTDTQNGSLSDYLFGQFFAHDNFLAKSGREVIAGTADYGFQPMGELFRYTDANMLHLANLEYGYLVIGYCYYAIHVVIVDLILYLTLFIPRLLRNIVERLEGKGNV